MAIDLRAAIEERLGHDVVVYAAGLRAAGRSWREISDEIRDRTRIDVSYETLRQWVRLAEQEKARAS